MARGGAGLPRLAAARQKAFTLVEVLVVLLIVSLVSGILFQALEQVFRLQLRFGDELSYTQQDAMSEDWFRQGIEGLLPDYPNGANIFKGTERKLSGLSTNTLSVDYGAPLPLILEISADPESGAMRLLNGEGKDAAPILTWPGTTGRFRYVDQKGEAHESWPPPLGLWPQIPSAIWLEADLGGKPSILVAVPMGPVSPMPRASDFFGTTK